ncbi:MAG: PRC-barrel domain-containing protein [Alphaproteobacteria bacterium]
MANIGTQISSDQVEGTDVYGPDGEKIGKIDRVMIEKTSGKVTYAVMTFGGFLGFGEEEYPLPWATLRYDTRLNGYIANVTADQVKTAPVYATDDEVWSNREWESRVHQHYGVSPYWP